METQLGKRLHCRLSDCKKGFRKLTLSIDVSHATSLTLQSDESFFVTSRAGISRDKAAAIKNTIRSNCCEISILLAQRTELRNIHSFIYAF